MTRAYRLTNVDDDRVKTIWENYRYKRTAPTIVLSGVPLHYVLVEGKFFYSVTDVADLLAPLAVSKDAARNKIYGVLKHHAGKCGQGRVLGLPRGIYGDAEYLTFFVKSTKLLDDWVKAGTDVSDNPAVNAFLLKLYRGAVFDHTPVSQENGFRYSDFTRVVPETLRAGNWKSLAPVNVPLPECQKALVKPITEEPLPEEIKRENHPVEKSAVVISDGTSITTDDRKADAAAQDAEHNVSSILEITNGLVRALLEGKRLSINVTVAIE